MDRQELVLAALAPARGGLHSPVQVQKLLFLVDRNMATDLGGPHFDFRPYNYGPFDKAVYETLEALAADGKVDIVYMHNWADYALTSGGQELGDEIFAQLPARAREYIQKASNFVRSLSFTQLVSAIYKAYPEMRQNSVFQE